MNIDIVVVERPIPPCAMGSDKYDGTHRFKPHHANIVAAFISVSVTMMRSGTRPGSGVRGPGSGTWDPGSGRTLASRERVHISGSSRLRRIQSVKIAGMMPTKNTARQPYVGSTRATTMAAAP